MARGSTSASASVPLSSRLAVPAGARRLIADDRTTTLFAAVVDDDPTDVDGEQDEGPGLVSPLLTTLGWYVVPLTLYLGYILTLGNTPAAVCVSPPCSGPRQTALTGLAQVLPWLAVALAISLGVALALRAFASGWRALTIGFASSVIGAGVATVVFSLIAKP